MRILYVGSGAVNLCLAGWMHSGAKKTTFLVRTADNEIIRTGSFQCRLPGDKNTRVYRCGAVTDLSGIERPDLVVIGVKSYSLDGVLDTISSAFGPDITVMSVLNGVRHLELVSTRFRNTIFATILFNAYRVSPMSAVAEGGELSLSSFQGKTEMMELIHDILKRKTSVSLVNDPRNAVHNKLIINLGNALLTLVAYHTHRNRELEIVQKLSAAILWEGVTVMKRHGIKEENMAGLTPWGLLWLNKTLPTFIMLPFFKAKMRTSTINSMAQDIQNGAEKTELEDINGYFIQLADRLGVEVPYNRALYHIFKEWVQTGERPMKPSVLLSRIRSFSNL